MIWITNSRTRSPVPLGEEALSLALAKMKTRKTWELLAPANS
jgi:hypothetical protein